MDVLDDLLFYNNGNSTDSGTDVENNVAPDNDNYDVIFDRSDDTNPPPLPLEPSPYIIIMPFIHSNLPNDGEIILIFSPVY